MFKILNKIDDSTSPTALLVERLSSYIISFKLWVRRKGSYACVCIISRRNKDRHEDPLDPRSMEPVFLDNTEENSLHRFSRLQDGRVYRDPRSRFEVFCSRFMNDVCTNMYHSLWDRGFFSTPGYTLFRGWFERMRRSEHCSVGRSWNRLMTKHRSLLYKLSPVYPILMWAERS